MFVTVLAICSYIPDGDCSESPDSIPEPEVSESSVQGLAESSNAGETSGHEQEAGGELPEASSPCGYGSGMHPAVTSGDFGKVVLLKAERNLSKSEMVFLLNNHFIPGRNYQFPSRLGSGHNRHFQHSWLDKHNGLVYSESEDGGYCKFCVLFGKCGPTMKEFGVLVNRPLIDYKRATEKLTEHFHGKKFHKAALQSATAFMTSVNNPNVAD